MCGIVLDALVLAGLVMALNQDESPEIFKAILAAIGVAVVGGLAFYGLALVSGLLALVLIPVLFAAAAGFVLWLVFDTPPLKSAIGGGVFAFYKLLMIFVFAWLFSGAAT
jgi:hypothetical protein